MLARNELPVVRFGRCVRIPRQAPNLWVNQSLEANAAVRDAFLGLGQS
jgi:hypothetical protein